MNERNLDDNPEKVHLIYFASHLQQKFSYCISSISLSDKLNYFYFRERIKCLKSTGKLQIGSKVSLEIAILSKEDYQNFFHLNVITFDAV